MDVGSAALRVVFVRRITKNGKNTAIHLLVPQRKLAGLALLKGAKKPL
jgi:hypothetical protein